MKPSLEYPKRRSRGAIARAARMLRVVCALLFLPRAAMQTQLREIHGGRYVQHLALLRLTEKHSSAIGAFCHSNVSFATTGPNPGVIAP